MTVTDSELLRRYTDQKSDDAFTELVGRHLDLVHSAALRQVDGDEAAAADVAQAVFSDLARKAGQLIGHTSLTGWLYTSTRFLAANVRRTEQRRRTREQQAYSMNQLLQTANPEPDWDKIRPVLDETMHKLEEADRDAVLWRYFERRSHTEIGARLGITENAARMRVERALDRLRAGLANRGISSTGAALGVAIGQHSVAAAPLGMVAQVSRSALAAARSGATPATPSFLRRSRMAVALGALALLVSVPMAVSRWTPETPIQTEDSARAGAEANAAAEGYGSRVQGTDESAAIAGLGSRANLNSELAPGTNTLFLTVLAAESGKPVPNVPLDLRSWESDRFAGRKYVTLRDGTCRVTYPTNVTEFQLTTRVGGFADTRLEWSPKRGEKIPSTYTLKLVRPAKLAGRVVDSDGQPVEGAKVGFNHNEDPATSKRPESHEFSWIEVVTDDAGRWEINRIAEEMVRRIYGSARHSEYVDSPMIFVGKDSSAEGALRAGTHEFRLGRAIEVIGVVVDPENNPVPGAKVALGNVGSSMRRETTTQSDGTFALRGCPLGRQLVSAEAAGFATTTESIELGPDAAPIRLTLKAGARLLLRVVNRDNQPVPKANVWLDTFQRGPIDPNNPGPPPVQAEVDLQTDEDGRVVWAEAPPTELTFDVYARGYMRLSGYKVRPDGEEHTVVLPPALTVFGSVKDANTGKPVPKVRMITGWPRVEYGPISSMTNADWSTLERFWMSFAGGQYRHSFDEPVIGGMKNPGYILKFEAEGYASFVSRTIAADEGDVQLDVALRPAQESKITVLTPSGTPARGAEVAQLGAGAKAMFDGRSFEPNGSPGMIRIITDERGQFQLPGDDAITRILIAHNEGFADVRPLQADRNEPWILRAWGSIEGHWVTGEQPAAGREILVQAADGLTGPLQFDFTRFRLETDANGRFRCDRVPPGTLKLVRLTRQEQSGGRTTWSHGKAEEVVIKSGEVTTVTLGEKGYTASVRLVWPAGVAREANWKVFGGIHTALPPAWEGVPTDPQLAAQLQQNPEFQTFVKTMRQFPFSVLENIATAEEVEPGEYALMVMVMAEPLQGTSPKPILSGSARVTVPAEPGSGKIDLGHVVLQAPASSAGGQ